MPSSKYTNANLSQTVVTGPFGFPLNNSDGASNEIRVAKKNGKYSLAIKTDNAWRYFDENLKSATASTLGTIKVGSGLSITSDGVLSTTGGGGSGDITGVTLTADDSGTAADSSGDAALTIAGGNAISTTATGTTLTINHDDTSSQASVDNSGYSYIQDITLDTYGHITGITSSTWSLADEAVTLAKMQHIATDTFLGRTSSGTGDVEVMSVGDVNTLLGLDSYITSLNLTGLTDVTINSGTVTGGHFVRHSGSGWVNATIQTGDITSAMVTQHEDDITHDNLTGFVANEHIDWTADQGSTNIHSGNYTDTNTMGAGFKIADGDSNHDVTEGHYLKIVTQSSGTAGVGVVSGDGGSGNPWIITLNAPNTTYSAMGSGNSYAAGLVLAGASSHGNTYLRKDGTWTLPSIHIQDDDGDSITVDIDEHIKITGTGGITTDWTTDDAGSGSGTPNILTIGVGNITNVGTVTSGVWNATAIASQYLDADTAHLSGTQTFTGAKTFSAAATMYGLQINAGSGDNTSGQDATLYISATSDNDWGIKLSKPSNEYGQMIDVAPDASYALRILGNGTQKFNVSGAGVITTATWNGAVIASAYLDADTAHLSGTQTFSGAKTFSSTTTFSNTSSYGDLDIIPTSSNRSVIKHDSGSGSLTLRGDQINLQNKDGDHTGLSYNDGSGLIGATNTHISYTAGQATSTATGGAFIAQGSDIITGRVFLQGYQNGGGDLVGFNNESDKFVMYNYTDNNYIAKFGYAGSITAITSVLTGDGNHTLTSLSTTHLEIKGAHTAAVGIKLSAGGNLRGWLYANDSQETGFLDTGGSWDLKKAENSHLLVYGSGSNVAKFGSGDEWGRIEFDGFSNGIYVYTDSGDFKVDGGHWNPYGNNDTDLGGDSLRWRNLKLGNHIIGGFGARETGGTTDWNDSTNARSGQGHTLLLGNATNGPSGTSDYFHPFTFEYNSKDGGGNMTQLAIPYIATSGGGMYMRSRYSSSWGGWINIHDSNNRSGLARTGSTYGSFKITDGGGSYPGHVYGSHSNIPTVMFNDSTSSGGIYYQYTGRWALFHNYGHNCTGIDTSSTETAYELKVNGDILATGDVVAFSDARWKTEIETISNPIDKIMDMRGVYYKELPKGDKKVSDRRKMGVIAQEILKVAPEVVTYGEINDEYAVDYSKLVGILIEGIKELKQEINELKGS